MTKLTEHERESFEKIFKEDWIAINSKFMSQIKDFWVIARKEIMKLKGWDLLEQEKQKLEKEINKAKARTHEIEEKMNSEDLRPEQIAELGGKENEFGRFSGARFYGIPVTSQFEYEIVGYIKERINLDFPAKVLRDICSASMRELAMSGTFETAKESYQKFYSLDFRKYGVDIPPRLDDITKNKKLISYAGKSLNQNPEPEKEGKQ